MADRLARVRFNGREFNMGLAHAKLTDGVEILDQAPTNRDGSLRGETRVGGRPLKPRLNLRDLTGPQLDELTVPELKNELDARNDARGEGEAPIEVEAPGNKPQLVAALAADNETSAANPTTQKEQAP